MSSKITLKNIKDYKKASNSNNQVKLARNAAVRGDVMDLAWIGKCSER